MIRTDRNTPATSTPDNTVYDLRKYDDFITEFKRLLSALPDFTILQLPDVALDDGTDCHVFHIDDTQFGDTYRLQVDTNKDSKITRVNLRTKRLSYGNLQFAVFALYAYKSMGFPEVDADSFYDKYDLFSKDEILERDMCEAYQITSMTIDTYITFIVSC